MATLFQLPKTAPVFGGESLQSAKLYFFQSGTLTPITTYTTAALSVAHTHPVVADGDGVFPAIFLNESVNATYRMQLKDSTDVLQYDTDSLPTGLNPNNLGVYVSVGGTANAITLNPSLPIASYAAGQTFRFVASSSNTSAVTVSVSGLATKSISKVTLLGGVSDLVEGDILSGGVYTITYDGTRFQLVGQIQSNNGIYTATATGGTTSPTVSVRYAVSGKIVSLYVPATTFTSNDTAYTLTGAPAEIRPYTVDSAFMPAPAFTDNGTVEYGTVSARMTTAGTLEFFRNASATGFTNSGTKGLTLASSFFYNLDTTPP